MSVPETEDAPAKQRAKGAPGPTAAGPDRLRLHVQDAAERDTHASRSSLLLVALLLVMTGGLGVCAWLLVKEQQQSHAQGNAKRAAERALLELRNRSGGEITELQHGNAEQAQRLTQADAEQLELKANLAAAQARLEALEAERAQLGALMTEYRAVAQQFRSMIDSGKLSVNFRRGRMIVELPAAVLFASGSAELSAEGSGALNEVAAILHNVPGKRFIVAGHTDNVPLSKVQSGYSSNWALSAGRAVTVTEALLNAGLPPADLVAAGYGEYDPITTNATPQGRQKNRRIEIVLEPQLAALPNALETTAEPAATKAGATPR